MDLENGLTVHWVRVRISFLNGGCDLSAHVTLVGRTGPLAEGAANEQCVVQFTNVPEGSYHVSVSGQNTTEVDAGVVTMTAGGESDFDVHVNRAVTADRAGGQSALPVVSAVDLAVPAAARKEFDKANNLIARQDQGRQDSSHHDLDQAKDRLLQAIAIYPAYASAYNSLGVIYARHGDRVHEREVLEKAISLDSHFAPAYVNLGRMNIAAGDLPAAEAVLNKAYALAPTDPMTLVLLSFAQIGDNHFDDAIASSKKAHALGGTHAFVHQAAARAYERKRDAADAIAELEMFLKEEPTGTRSDAARKELEAVRAIPR